MKHLTQFAGTCLALPCMVRYVLLRRVLGSDRALSVVSEHAARRPGLLGIYARQAFYRRVLQQAGRDIHFGYQTLLSKPDACIGDRVYLGRGCTVGWVEIEDDARIADGVQLLSGQHHHGSTTEGVDLTDVSQVPIRIGRGAWIGANAVVMADVGDGAIVGAGAVVTRPVPPGVTEVGVPAKPIVTRKQTGRAA